MATARYTRTAIVLHWLMAVLLLAQIGIGAYMVDIPKRTPPVAFYYGLHKSIGLLAMALVLVRLWWKSRHPAPSLAGLALSSLEIQAARISHRLLYACMVLTPLCGFAASNFTRHGVSFFGIALPRLGWEDQALHLLFSRMHAGFAWLLCGLIAVHVLAALGHTIKSGTLVVRRMLPH
jgi:cytochrome b561